MTLTWVKIGNAKGPKGDQGIPGPPGAFGGTYPGGDLFTAAQGFYYVANGATVPNWPTALAGVGGHVLIMSQAGVKAITVWSYGLVAGVYGTQTNSSGSNTFFPWRRQDHPKQGRLTPTGDNDVLRLDRPDGEYEVRSATDAAGITGLPTPVPGTLRSLWMTQTGLGVRFLTYFAQGASSGGMWLNWTNTTVGSHTWVGWQKMATKADVDAVAATVQPLGLNKRVLMEEFTRRRGKIAADKAFIALRLDDPINGIINNGLAAEFSNRGLPASLAICSASFTDSDMLLLSNLGSFAMVKDWAHKQGFEVHHHGGNHKDASGTSNLTREIVTSLANLKASLPTLEVNKWMQPGVGSTNYDGFAATNTTELLYQHVAAKLLADGHSAISGGQLPGLIRQLDGKPRDGLLHTLVEAPAKLAAVYDHIDVAVEEKAGLCIMMHPNNLNRAGDYITTADYLAMLDYLVTLREQGKLEIVTVSGLLCADSSSTKWTQLIRDNAFAGGFAKWLGSTGWTVAGGIASTAGTNLLGQSHSMLRHGWMRGGTMQLKAEVRATTGAVVRLHQSSNADPAGWTAEKDFTLAASAAWVPLRLNACVPLTLDATPGAEDAVWSRIGRVSGGTLEVRNIEYRPI